MEVNEQMIVWLLSKRQRRYFYLTFVVVLLDLIVGPMLIAWELRVLKGMM